MRVCYVLAIILSGILSSVSVLADQSLSMSKESLIKKQESNEQAFTEQLSKLLLVKNERQSLLPNKNAAIGESEAAALVKGEYQNSKILSIKKKRRQGGSFYKVKTLSADGVVKYVFVDAISGDVYE